MLNKLLWSLRLIKVTFCWFLNSRRSLFHIASIRTMNEQGHPCPVPWMNKIGPENPLVKLIESDLTQSRYTVDVTSFIRGKQLVWPPFMVQTGPVWPLSFTVRSWCNLVCGWCDSVQCTLYRVRSHAPSIQSHRGTKVVWPDIQPMRVPEEPVCIDLFRQNPVSTSLHLKSPVHVVPPQ